MTDRPLLRAAAGLAGGAALWLALVAAQLALPAGWDRIGGRGYEVTLDATGGRGGTACVRLRGIDPREGRFTGVAQTVDASPWRGKRLRLSAWIRSEDMDGWGGLFMRIDDDELRPLGFGNNRNAPVGGTTGWSRYQVVLDVPGQAREIQFGVHLNGKGVLWADDFALDPLERR